ncbi:MAG: hypothetical protein ACRDOI_41875, partial [Trebonia sp.]
AGPGEDLGRSGVVSAGGAVVLPAFEDVRAAAASLFLGAGEERVVSGPDTYGATAVIAVESARQLAWCLQ